MADKIKTKNKQNQKETPKTGSPSAAWQSSDQKADKVSPKKESPSAAWTDKKPHRPFGWPVLVAIGIVGLLWWFFSVYTALGFPRFGFLFTHTVSRIVTHTSVNTDTNTATTDGKVPRRLDGVLVDKGKADFLPYAVMIENLLVTRPQSGLSQAGVVYEALAEGGATRFMAVFDPSIVIPELMPVRSARPYYIEWMSEYGALYAHAGGSPKALTVIRENADIHNLDALTSDGKYFWRDHTKYAPHNLVTSSEKMNIALRDKSLTDTVAIYRSWLFKDDAVLADRGENGKIVSFNFSYGKTYKVDYRYNQEKNVYLRFNADQPHLDKNTNEQITVKNVVIQLVQDPTLAGEKGRLDIYVGGTGKAWIFIDGQVIEGTWQKNSRTDRTLFFDKDGKEVEFNRGNTWVHVLPKDQAVTYQ
jgi:hypothetical protein